MTVNNVAALPPNVSAVAPVKAEPMMKTEAPPVEGPLLGLTELTVGTDR